jgi:uncharacterized membrane protein YccC
MTTLSALYQRIRRWDPLRLAVQTATGAIVTYGAGRLLGLQEISWAMFSALFVVQASVGGTFGTAVSRVIGAGIGLVLGLACIFLIGTGGWKTVLSLALSVGTMSFIAGLKPSLSYGLVTVGMLVVAPGFEVIEGALEKTFAIALGSIVGAVVAATVLPLAAHRSADKHLGNAVRRCGDLLAASTESLLGKGDSNLQPIHSDIEGEIGKARAMTSQSQFGRTHRHAHRPLPRDLLREVEHLWYSLALIDRLTGKALPDGPRKKLEEPVVAATEACHAYLSHLGDAVAACERPDPPDDVRCSIEAVTQALDKVREERITDPLSDWETERVFSLSFAWQQIGRDIDALVKLMTPRDAGRAGSAQAASRPRKSSGFRPTG